MDYSQLFDGIAFGSQIAPVVLLDCLPPCACGSPSDDPLLRAIFALLDGGFSGVRELKGDSPSTYLKLVLTYTGQANTKALWLSMDPGSIEGKAILALLHEVKSGTTRIDRDLAAHAIHVIEIAYAEAGREGEFYAAMQRALEIQRQAGAMQ
ncbi:hypothetical protein [Pseudomonas sp. GWSMS-1]|uniref:hypothetical protein n=1 Tax=Pseudomonas sp. GWSMS-1 TaxID=3308997 RepID=UPI003CE831FF